MIRAEGPLVSARGTRALCGSLSRGRWLSTGKPRERWIWITPNADCSVGIKKSGAVVGS